MKWSDPNIWAPDQAKLCGKYNVVKFQQPNVVASKRYLLLFQNGRTARNWKLKETRHIIPEWKCARPKRLSVQFHTHFPSDAKRTMLLDPVAAADTADNADTADIHILTVRNVCCPATMLQWQFWYLLFSAFRHIIFQRFQLLDVFIASIPHCKNWLRTFLH
jgi:hypothetical protein